MRQYTRSNLKDRYDWPEVQKYFDSECIPTFMETCRKFGMTTHSLSKAIKLGLFKSRTSGKTCRGRRAIGLTPPPKPPSKETRAKLSSFRTNYIKQNPDYWKRLQQQKSVPCERVKEWLRSKNLSFVCEQTVPETNRHFRLDIAFPQSKTAIEVNGTQHYERDGSLKPYYVERHSLLEQAGWTIIEMHYSLAFNIQKLEKFFGSILFQLSGTSA
jgi:very-short-patch-repair endonuclease